MNILVTGHYGFIASNFLHYWFSKYDDNIVGVDKLTYASNVNNLIGLPHQEAHVIYDSVIADINDTDFMYYLLCENQIDVVIHFAAESSVDKSITEPKAFIDSNINGTYNLLEATRQYRDHSNENVRFIAISSDEVFGSLTLYESAFTEDSPYKPNSPYSASKAASDHLVRAYAETYKLNTNIINCSNNYGPRQHVEKFIPTVITRALKDQPIPIYGSGLNIRDWLYVKDHCRAIDIVVQNGVAGETYLVGGNEVNQLTNLELVSRILTLLDKPSSLIEFVEDRKGHDFRYAINHDKITKELGWTPRTDLMDGLTKTIEWYEYNKN